MSSREEEGGEEEFGDFQLVSKEDGFASDEVSEQEHSQAPYAASLGFLHHQILRILSLVSY